MTSIHCASQRLPYGIAFAALLILLAPPPLVAQQGDSEASVLRVSGTAMITGDVYSFSASPAGAESPRRPTNLWRFIINPTISIGEQISLPFSFMFSSRQTNFITAAAGSQSFLQMLQNPMNSFGVSPRIGWAQLHLGTHTPRFSELSAGDEQLFGAGFDLSPGNVRAGVSVGTAQRAIEPDSARGIRGAYARHLTMLKGGYGRDDGSFVQVNFVRAKDDVSSLRTRPSGLAPQEGLVLTTNFRVALAERISLTGELGGSGYTRDMEADIVENNSPVPSSILTQRISTRADVAGMLAFAVNEKQWGVKVSGKYIGAGYMTLAYPFMTPDRLDMLLAPRLKLFENRLAMNGSVGYRMNNLSSTKSATSTQLLGSLNALALFTDRLSLAARYANFGIRNNMKNDTLKIEQVSNSLSISPTYVIPSGAADHMLSLSWSLDAFNDYNVVSGATSSNNTMSLLGMYAVSLTRIPLTASFSLSRMTNDLPLGNLTIHSADLSAAYRFLDGSVLPSLTLSYTENSSAGFTKDTQWLLRAAAQWNVLANLAFTAAISSNRYTYGSSRPGVFFTETFFQTGLAVRF